MDATAKAARPQDGVIVETRKTIQLPKAVTVKITVEKDKNGAPILVASPSEVILDEGVQIAWTCPDGKLELRFNPGTRPFVGDSYEAGRGGIVYSGPTAVRGVRQNSYEYTALVTTKSGLFLRQNIKVTIKWTTATAKP